jgi:lysophospholipase L1-like esterase
MVLAAGVTVAVAALVAGCGPGDSSPQGTGGSTGTAGGSARGGSGGAAASGGSAGGSTGGGAGHTGGIGGNGAGGGGTGGGLAGAGGAGTAGAGGGVAGQSGQGGQGGQAGQGGSSGRGGAAGGSGGTGGGAGAGGRGGSAGGTGGQGGASGRGGSGGGDGGVTDGSAPDGGAFRPCPTTGGTACAVLPLGDSITEGYLPGGANGGYRVELFRQAVLAGKNITFVGTQQNGPTMVDNRTFPRRHEGRGGYTIAGGGQGALAGAVTDNAIAMYRPHIVLLMIGTNDINGNINVSTAPTRLGQLIDEIIQDAPDALVVVASIIPIANDGTNQRIPNYNAAIPGLVATRAAAGKHVVFLDNHAAFIRDTNFRTTLMVDNLHPNAAGYAVLGQSFYGAISAVLSSGP